MQIRYTHTNLIARDWRRLADFYITVFGCQPKPPERDLSGDWVDDLTGLPAARIRGMHLALPGCGPDGPTLEIFQYPENQPNPNKMIHTEGFGHIAFSVADVDGCLADVLRHGGGQVGEVVKGWVPGVGNIHLVYARDPEGNIIEIQKWE